MATKMMTKQREQEQQKQKHDQEQQEQLLQPLTTLPIPHVGIIVVTITIRFCRDGRWASS